MEDLHRSEIALWRTSHPRQFGAVDRGQRGEAAGASEEGLKAARSCQMLTLTSYGIAVVVVLAILNGIFWLLGDPRLHEVNVFSAVFVLGMLGMYIAAWLYGYRQVN